jgi:hypothetical protein
MRTTLEPRTRPRPRSLGKTTERQAEPERLPITLDAAKKHLEKLSKQLGIQSPVLQGPTTLDKVRSEIYLLEQMLVSAGKRQTMAPLPEAKITAPPVPESSEDILLRGAEIAAKYAQASEPAGSASSGPTRSRDARNLSRSELTAALDKAPPQQVGALFHELRRRERGEPSRQSIQIAQSLDDLELEQAIEREKDVERRTELFHVLLKRNARK